MVPEWLENYAKGSVSTAGYVPMGGKFGGKDIRKGVQRVSTEGQLNLFITWFVTAQFWI